MEKTYRFRLSDIKNPFIRVTLTIVSVCFLLVMLVWGLALGTFLVLLSLALNPVLIRFGRKGMYRKRDNKFVIALDRESFQRA